MSTELVEHAGEVYERVTPMPGEMWLIDGENIPIIVTKLTRDRVSYIVPCADDPGYRESWMGTAYFFAERYTRLWPR